MSMVHKHCDLNLLLKHKAYQTKSYQLPHPSDIGSYPTCSHLSLRDGLGTVHIAHATARSRHPLTQSQAAKAHCLSQLLAV